MKKFKIPNNIPMISPIISSFETTTVMPSSSSSSMNSLNIENERKQQQQKSSTTMTNTVVSGEKSNEIEILAENKLCRSCSKLLMEKTILTMQECMKNLLTIVDTNILREYNQQQQQQQQQNVNNNDNKNGCEIGMKNLMIDDDHDTMDGNIGGETNVKVLNDNNRLLLGKQQCKKINGTILMDKQNVSKYHQQQQQQQQQQQNRQQNQKHGSSIIPICQHYHDDDDGNSNINDNDNRIAFEVQKQQQQQQQQQKQKKSYQSALNNELIIEKFGEQQNDQNKHYHMQQKQQQQQQQQHQHQNDTTNYSSSIMVRNHQLESNFKINNAENKEIQSSNSLLRQHDDNRSAINISADQLSTVKMVVDDHNQKSIQSMNKNIMENGKSKSTLMNMMIDSSSKTNNNNNNDDHFHHQHDHHDSPFAYVTIVTNNLQAINAIIMANSLYYYNNHNLTIYHDDDDNQDGNSRIFNIRKHYRIPLIVFINNNCDHQQEHIDHKILVLINKFFDQVIELKSNDFALLNNESLGIRHLKVNLWKYLSQRGYRKCIYLESNTLIVGNISNLFHEYSELAASVDCFFPDYFNCSVFVFEPNEQTYRQLIHFGSSSHRFLLQSNADDASKFEDDPLDEMTLLNEFFRPKWNRLSFIYNFVRNDLSYTQQSAYFRFGENIRVVNFGNCRNYRIITNNHHQHNHNNNHNNEKNFSLQPWDYKFDLSRASLLINNDDDDDCNNPFEHNAIDDYAKFYLLIFVRRVWPFISMNLIPLMIEIQNHGENQHQRNGWSVMDVVLLIGSRIDNDNRISTLSSSLSQPLLLTHHRRLSCSNFDQNPFTLRRISTSTMNDNNDRIFNDNNNNNNNNNDTDNNDNVVRINVISNHENQTEKEFESSNVQEFFSDGGVTMTIDNNNGDNKNKDDWERGQIDWMHQHQSDKIIDRLLTKF
ncbi:Glycogenin-2 [Dermatophagoides farinae]|uniref:Glycogenin-2 n=1 Tax=Dermatophagoides farinae TaxID=6954 RepID=A0A922HFF8_DERFA|nr:Glycogenin-2 [Dermatophagoides farinae]